MNADARSEIPKVSYSHIIDEIPALRVNCCDPRGTVEHIGPFGGLVPMQLPTPPAFSRMFTPAMPLETPSSRTVTWRVHRPNSSRICGSEKE